MARRLLALTAGLLCLSFSVKGQSGEYRLKAAYLCRLIDYVDWPSGTFAATNSPLVIGVLGRDPFGAALDEVAQGQMSHGHPLVIRRYSSASEVSGCDELFICGSEASKANMILRELGGKPILTVSDIGAFSADGGCIRFYTEGRKVRFSVNLEAVKACGLNISSRLLQLADVTREKKEAP